MRVTHCALLGGTDCVCLFESDIELLLPWLLLFFTLLMHKLGELGRGRQDSEFEVVIIGAEHECTIAAQFVQLVAFTAWFWAF